MGYIHQTFRWYQKMEVRYTYISCMDTAYVREEPNPYIAENML